MTSTLFNLSGKTALVTGGNGGIGLGMAKALASAGADIAIWGTNESKNAAAIEDLKTVGNGKYHAWKVDVSDEKAVDDAFETTLSSFGRVDTVIANAGIGRLSKSFDQMDTKDFKDIMAINVEGVFFTLRAAARHMVERSKMGDTGGSLIGIASLAAVEGAARNEHYSASKGAVTSMMRSIAVEYARYGIRANSILPGWIATDMTAGAQDSDVFNERVISRVPMRRWGSSDDFGGIAVYLASDASSFHTGDMFLIDGGYSIF